MPILSNFPSGGGGGTGGLTLAAVTSIRPWPLPARFM